MLNRTTGYMRFQFNERNSLVAIMASTFTKHAVYPERPDIHAVLQEKRQLLLEEVQNTLIETSRYVKDWIDDKLTPVASKYTMTDKQLIDLLTAIGKKLATLFGQEMRIMSTDECTSMFKEGVKPYYVEPTAPEGEITDDA